MDKVPFSPKFERISWLLSKVWKCFAFFTNQQTHHQRQRAGRQRSQFRSEGDFVGGVVFCVGFCWDQMFYVWFLLVSSNQDITRIRNHTGFLVDSHHSWEKLAKNLKKKKDSSSTHLAFLCANISWLVVSTRLKNISQIGSFPQVRVKIKNIWNHQVVSDFVPENKKHPQKPSCHRTQKLSPFRADLDLPQQIAKVIMEKSGKQILPGTYLQQPVWKWMGNFLNSNHFPM